MPIRTNLTDLINRLKAVRENIIKNRPDNIQRIASDTLALTKRRVQQTGIDSEGQSFVDYDPIYAVKGRQELGYQSDIVDFTRTGKMLNSVKAFPVSSNDSETVVEVKASRQSEQDKLNGQFRLRGNILLPNSDEIEFATQANDERVQNELNKL